MTEIYHLDHSETPSLPCPHDCVIKEIKLENDFLIFVFEDDISYHDSIDDDIKTLSIKYHLTDKDFLRIIMKKRGFRFLHPNGYFEEISFRKITSLLKNEVTYLYHFFRFGEIIIELASPYELILNFETDYIEYEWTQK